MEGKIFNMDVVHNDKMKFVIMAFDEGTGLSEHAAPGEAIIFALDGEVKIYYSQETFAEDGSWHLGYDKYCEVRVKKSLASETILLGKTIQAYVMRYGMRRSEVTGKRISNCIKRRITVKIAPGRHIIPAGNFFRCRCRKPLKNRKVRGIVVLVSEI